jgi:hypothetical protein
MASTAGMVAEPGGRTYTLLGADRCLYRSAAPGWFGGHRKSKIYGRLDCPAALRAIGGGGYAAQRVFFADERTELQIQELLLALQAVGVAVQLAVAADDPVTGDQDGQRVTAHRGADLLGVLAAAKTAGEVAVGGGLPVGNLRDQLPDTELELRAQGA